MHPGISSDVVPQTKSLENLQNIVSLSMCIVRKAQAVPTLLELHIPETSDLLHQFALTLFFFFFSKFGEALCNPRPIN